MNVEIRGSGVAALCSAHLLTRAGLRVSMEEASRPKLPVVMLSGPSLALMHDVFGDLSCLATLPRIRRRVVAWGQGAEAVTMPHSAVVASEDTLLRLFAGSLRTATESTADWTILAAPPADRLTPGHCFGDRRAKVAAVTLRADSPSDACWVESIESGWLFLIPNAPQRGYLLAVGDEFGTMFGKSRLVAGQVDQVESVSGEFPAHPRIHWPLCGPGWLACGTAAMAFDPLCGDGVAHAVREAILAAAVVRAISSGADEQSLLAHYRARMAAGLARHLRLAGEFYQSGHPNTWWTSQLAAMRRGEDWCAQVVSESVIGQTEGKAKFQYQLDGFDLRPAAYA
jgi:2-polyprenyl-6-methoxyphenol hydroxylase-like FAD-dependent oxidoreductase